MKGIIVSQKVYNRVEDYPDGNEIKGIVVPEKNNLAISFVGSNIYAYINFGSEYTVIREMEISEDFVEAALKYVSAITKLKEFKPTFDKLIG